MQTNPGPQGLYRPEYEHDACGIGFVVNLKGTASHAIVRQGIQVLENLVHRGACGCDPETGDGAGMLTGLIGGRGRQPRRGPSRLPAER